jgi:hypothetical protein
MQNTDWKCIFFDQYVKDVAVYGSTIRDSEQFMSLNSKWYRNIKEWGNMGSYLFTGPIVTMTGRTVDEAGWVAAGQSGDGTGFNFESMQDEVLTSPPSDAVTASFEGHRFWYYNALAVNRSGQYLDAVGSKYFGRSNLAPSDTFASGWSNFLGATVSGGVATFDATPTGWWVSSALGTPLQPGKYLIVVNAATVTGGANSYLRAGIRFDDATDNPATYGNGTGLLVAGRGYGEVTIPVGRTGTNLELYVSTAVPFTGTADEYFIVKVQ